MRALKPAKGVLEGLVEPFQAFIGKVDGDGEIAASRAEELARERVGARPASAKHGHVFQDVGVVRANSGYRADSALVNESIAVDSDHLDARFATEPQHRNDRRNETAEDDVGVGLCDNGDEQEARGDERQAAGVEQRVRRIALSAEPNHQLLVGRFDPGARPGRR